MNINGRSPSFIRSTGRIFIVIVQSNISTIWVQGTRLQRFLINNSFRCVSLTNPKFFSFLTRSTEYLGFKIKYYCYYHLSVWRAQLVKSLAAPTHVLSYVQEVR